MENSSKLNLPRVRKIQLERFSLFVLQPNVEINIPDGVFCLAGANGIGKSTFLAAVGYGITGIVPNPKITFRSAEGYYNDCLGFSKQYFEGKISEDDRDVSAITIQMQIKDEIFEITRGMFEPLELRSFCISLANSEEVRYDSSDLGPKERNQKYQEELAKSTGLSTFEQYVFLQHFVLTFDERRDPLLWNKASLLDAIFLAMGVDREQAQKADSVRDQRETYSSYGRNYKWQSTLVGREIEGIRKKVNAAEVEESLKELRAKYDTLIRKQAKLEADVEAKNGELRDVELQRMESASALTALQLEFSELFENKFYSRQQLELHPSIKNSISESICSICGTENHNVAENIEKKIKGGICPLCENAIVNDNPDINELDELRKVDENISSAKKQLETANKGRTRIQAEFRHITGQLESIKSDVSNLVSENQNLILKPLESSEDYSGLLAQKIQEKLDLEKSSDESYAQRDIYQIELISLYDELRRMYDEAQKEFVPLFRELSKLFIGVDMDIQMEYSTALDTTGMQFVLQMQGITRRQTYQLSESQRFFLDIALRMALAQYMSSDLSKASLFIDTPEGSLDLAYEARAGEMFARFAEKGHDLIMTANINSSQLLTKMAEHCGESKMTLHRMINWAQLSSIQQEEEQLFTDAYDKIDAILRGSVGING